MIEKRVAIQLLFLLSALQLTIAVDHETESSHSNVEAGHMPENMYDFLAARGRRDSDLFWANRGKRSSSRLKPNGFIFVMGKRQESGDIKKNSIKPNGFNFLLAGKRGARLRPNSFNIPLKRDGHNIGSARSIGLLPQGSGKMAENYINFNAPRPMGMMFPVSGKREDSKLAWKNMVRPNGFLFSMAKGKKSDDEVIDMNDLEIAREYEELFEDSLGDEGLQSFVGAEN